MKNLDTQSARHSTAPLYCSSALHTVLSIVCHSNDDGSLLQRHYLDRGITKVRQQ